MNKTAEYVAEWIVAIILFAAIMVIISVIGTLLTMGAWNYGVRAIWTVKPLTFWPAFWLWMAVGVIGKAFQSVNGGSK